MDKQRDAVPQLVRVSSADHNKRLVESLWKFFRTEHGVDFKLDCGGRMQKAHLLILGVFLSTKTLDVLNSSWQSQDVVEEPAESELVKREGWGANLDSLLEFLYRGEVVVPEMQLQGLLRIARELDFQMLVDAVVDLLPADQFQMVPPEVEEGDERPHQPEGRSETALPFSGLLLEPKMEPPDPTTDEDEQNAVSGAVERWDLWVNKIKVEPSGDVVDAKVDVQPLKESSIDLMMLQYNDEDECHDWASKQDTGEANLIVSHKFTKCDFESSSLNLLTMHQAHDVVPQLVRVSSADHNKKLVESLWKFFRTEHGVDFKLDCGGRMQKAHLLVLSVFLSTQTLGVLNSSWQSQGVVEEPAGSELVKREGWGANLDSLLEFLYRGEVSVTEMQLQGLLGIARELDFQMLVDAVVDFLPADHFQMVPPEVDEGDERPHPPEGQSETTLPFSGLLLKPKLEPPDPTTDEDAQNAVSGVVERWDLLVNKIKVEPSGDVVDAKVDVQPLMESSIDLMMLQYNDEDECHDWASKQDTGEANVIASHKFTNCDFESSSLNLLTTHQAHDVVRLDCPYCGRAYNDKVALGLHVSMVHGTSCSPFTCVTCGQRCTSHDSLFEHIRLQHSTLREVFAHLDPKSDCTGLVVQQNEQDIVQQKKLHCCTHCNYKTFRKFHLSQHFKLRHGQAGGQFSCQTCCLKFASADILMRHNRIHSRNRRFKCPYCSYAAGVPENIKKHLNVVHCIGAPRFSCETCGKRCAYLSELIRHRLTHTGERPFRCTYCSFGTSRRCRLKKHLQEHQSSAGRFPSKAVADGNKGSEPIGSRTKLVKHIQGVAKVRLFKCYCCTYAASRKEILKRHVTVKHGVSSDQFSCETCGMRFTSVSQLIKHFRTHAKNPSNEQDVSTSLPAHSDGGGNNGCSLPNPERAASNLLVGPPPKAAKKPAYRCSLCAFETRNRKLLQRHLKSIHQKPAYRCSLCAFETRNRKLLQRHLKSIHAISGTCEPTVKTAGFACGTCQVVCGSRRELAVHAKEAHYKDTLCSLGASSILALSSHADMVHGKESGQFQCRTCRKRCHSHSKLLKHVKTHKLERSFQCPRCPHLSRTKRSLKKHVARHGKKRKKKRLSESLGNSNLKRSKSRRGTKSREKTSIHQEKIDEKKKKERKLSESLGNSNLKRPKSIRGTKSQERTSVHKEKIDEKKKKLSESLGNSNVKRFKSIRGMKSQERTSIHKEKIDDLRDKGSGASKTQKLHSSTKKIHRCWICNFKTRIRKSYCDHMQLVHKVSPKSRRHRCKVCGKRFHRRYALKIHKRSHTLERPFSCSNCPYASSNSSNLKRHMARKHGTAHGSSPSSKSVDQLEMAETKLGDVSPKHFEDSSLETPAPTLENQQRFRDSIDKNSWENCLHVPLALEVISPEGLCSQGRYACKICSQNYELDCALAAHEHIHTLETQLQCPICPHVSATKSNLNEHLALHLNANAILQNVDLLATVKIEPDGSLPSSVEPFPIAIWTAASEMQERSGSMEATTHRCLYCKFAAKSRKGHRRHMKLVHGITDEDGSSAKNEYECQTCGQLYSSSITLALHERTHSIGPLYKCMVCTFASSEKRALRRHLLAMHGPDAGTNEIDNASINSSVVAQEITITRVEAKLPDDESTFSSQEKVELVQKYSCPYCPFTTLFQDAFRFHMKAKIHLPAPVEAKSPHEESTFSSQEGVEPARMVQKYSCAYCSFTTSFQEAFRLHMKAKIHLPAPVEAKSPNEESTYSSHEEVELVQKYSCPYCSFTTSSQETFRLHMKAKIHLPAPVKIFTCKTCGKSFPSRAKMATHKRTHSQESTPKNSETPSSQPDDCAPQGEAPMASILRMILSGGGSEYCSLREKFGWYHGDSDPTKKIKK